MRRRSASRSFRFFETLDLYSPMEELAKPRVWMGVEDYLPVGVAEELVLTIPRGRRKTMETVLEINQDIKAPIQLGDELGKAKVVVADEVVATVPVVALQALEENHFFARLWDMILMWVASLFNPA